MWTMTFITRILFIRCDVGWSKSSRLQLHSVTSGRLGRSTAQSSCEIRVGAFIHSLPPIEKKKWPNGPDVVCVLFMWCCQVTKQYIPLCEGLINTLQWQWSCREEVLLDHLPETCEGQNRLLFLAVDTQPWHLDRVAKGYPGSRVSARM